MKRVFQLLCGILTGVGLVTAVEPVAVRLSDATPGQVGDFAAFQAGEIAEWRLEGSDCRAVVELTFGEGMVFRGIRVVTTGGSLFLEEVEVSGDGVHWRPLLGRWINLPAWRGGGERLIELPPAAIGRFLRLTWRANFPGYEPGAGVRELEIQGEVNRPERHMLCWSGEWQRDYLDQLDFFEHQLGVTDLWLDYVETAFPQSNCNAGLASLNASGLLPELRKRHIRYWLGEHEAVTTMIPRPEKWHDDLAWNTVFREMHRIYPEAARLGFRGVVFDAENYFPLPEEVKRRYEVELQAADHAGSWTFVEEFGLDGIYYRRGLQFGRLFRELWPDGIFMQLYEARLYDGIPGCRDGNYWWLQGIADGGVREIWIATEKTYGAGNGEIAGGSDFLHRWFVRLNEFLPEVYRRYPMAARVLPGFHPWNTRLNQPMYLPRYLAEQLRETQETAPGCWLYFEGTTHGGNPLMNRDHAKWLAAGTTPEEYLHILQSSKTPSTRKGN